ARRLATWRRSRPRCGTAQRRSRAAHQGRPRRSQRDVRGGGKPHSRVASRDGADLVCVEDRPGYDRERRIKAVLVVHNETSTGVASRIPLVRRAIDLAQHPALLMVDTISSLGSMDYCHDEWGVDVTVAGSQKGLMLPPGLSFNAVSDKAFAASRGNLLMRSYWDWSEMHKHNPTGFFPYTPGTNLLFGLREGIARLEEEGLPK